MNILYLHGYNSTNISKRTEYLSEFGKVVNPLMNYKNIVYSYQYLENIVKKNKIDVIVGSSMGGFMGFYLGNYYAIPTILLNPALILSLIVNPEIRQFVTKNKHYISLGKFDNVIVPSVTKRILEQSNVDYTIKEFDIGHKTPFKIFKEICKISGLF